MIGNLAKNFAEGTEYFKVSKNVYACTHAHTRLCIGPRLQLLRGNGQFISASAAYSLLPSFPLLSFSLPSLPFSLPVAAGGCVCTRVSQSQEQALAELLHDSSTPGQQTIIILSILLLACGSFEGREPEWSNPQKVYTHIQTWEYSIYVFHKLLTIHVFGNAIRYLGISGNFPSSICGLDHSGSRPFIYCVP